MCVHFHTGTWQMKPIDGIFRLSHFFQSIFQKMKEVVKSTRFFFHRKFLILFFSKITIKFFLVLSIFVSIFPLSQVWKEKKKKDHIMSEGGVRPEEEEEEEKGGGDLRRVDAQVFQNKSSFLSSFSSQKVSGQFVCVFRSFDRISKVKYRHTHTHTHLTRHHTRVCATVRHENEIESNNRQGRTERVKVTQGHRCVCLCVCVWRERERKTGTRCKKRQPK